MQIHMDDLSNSQPRFLKPSVNKLLFYSYSCLKLCCFPHATLTQLHIGKHMYLYEDFFLDIDAILHTCTNTTILLPHQSEVEDLSDPPRQMAQTQVFPLSQSWSLSWDLRHDHGQTPLEGVQWEQGGQEKGSGWYFDQTWW